MTLYTYRCDDHGFFDTSVRDDRQPCPNCGGEGRRNFSFNIGDFWVDHYNPEFGSFLTSRKQAEDMAKTISEKKSLETGYEVKMGVVGMFDHDARGTNKEELAQEAARTKEFKAKAGKPA